MASLRLSAAMIERTFPPLPTPPQRGASPAASDAELHRAVQRAAAIPDGLALLEGAPLECAAVLLGLTPAALERVRAALEDGRTREAARALFARAAGRLPEAPARMDAPPSPPRDGEALLSAARRRAEGLALLLGAWPECAAIAFGVHPDLVHAARELARRRGLSQDHLPDA